MILWLILATIAFDFRGCSGKILTAGKNCGINTPYTVFGSVRREDLPLPDCSIVRNTKSLKSLMEECPECHAWENWAPCSATCNNGIKRRERACEQDEKLWCEPNTFEIKTCFIEECPKLCSEFTSNGMKTYPQANLTLFLSPQTDIPVGEVPDFCTDLGLEAFMPKDPEMMVVFKSMYATEIAGGRVGFGLRINPSVITCSNEGCNGELEWHDGTPFIYDVRYGIVNIDINAECTYFAETRIKNHYCHNTKPAACQVSCLP